MAQNNGKPAEPAKFVPPGPGYAPVYPPMVMGPPGMPFMQQCPGIDFLAGLDHLFVKQTVEFLELFTGFETNNRYLVLDPWNRPMYTATEDTDCLTRQCYGPSRPFSLMIRNLFGQDLMRLERACRCGWCCPCLGCCKQHLEVFCPPDKIAGTIEQECAFCLPNFKIMNASGNVVLRIDGPFCTQKCFGDVEFEVKTPDGSMKIGSVTSKWSGFIKEAFTDADNFGVNFPVDLAVGCKVLLLAAVFLLDFMFYEEAPKDNHSHRHHSF